ncbi:MAG TPA: pyridoxamine 5'-phosphate oxidase family protein [Firmicutes bacterium]|nr:pyridoxamine 5'-phosphate oxidase family protein [Bacillota bacterium]
MRGMRQIRSKTSYDDARGILDKAEYGVLSTACDDGLPYGVPLCFVLAGNALYFHTAAEGQKLDNIVRDRRACFTAVARAEVQPRRPGMAYQSAMAFGEVRIVYGEDERQAAFRLFVEKYSPALPAEKAAALRDAAKNTTVLRMDVEYISGKAAE